MKNESGFAKKLDSVLKRIRNSEIELQSEIDPIGQLVLGLLEWESTHANAKNVFDRLLERMVDYNDLRVSHPQEIKAIIGQRYPRADDRIDRLLKVVQEIYIRQHAVLLDDLVRKSKKEARAYLDSLPGMPPYVSAQVTLLCFSGHAMPVDEVLVELLRREKVVDQEATLEQVQSFLERRVRASDAVDTHALLRTWADANEPSLSESKSKTTKTTKTESQHSTKKSTTKASKTKKDSTSKTPSRRLAKK